jgi:hypothetical protein
MVVERIANNQITISFSSGTDVFEMKNYRNTLTTNNLFEIVFSSFNFLIAI